MAKKLVEVTGSETGSGLAVTGYEMHVGVTTGPDTARPMLTLSTGADGAMAAGAAVSGCYLHGLFSSDAFRTAYLQRLRPGAREALAYEAGIDATLDSLADHLEAHLDLDGMIDG